MLTHFCACLAWRDVRVARDQHRVWLDTTGLLGKCFGKRVNHFLCWICIFPSYRIAVLTISVVCVFFTVALAGYMYHHRKIKVFKVASPIFLMICLVGCGIMYLEMAAIFPILDMYACIATKWTRHMGKGFTQSNTARIKKRLKVCKFYGIKFRLVIAQTKFMHRNR